MGGSSSQPQPSQPPRSPINAFSLEELYTPDFSENIAYWQEPNPYKATGEQVATSPTKKKKATRNRQNRLTQTDDAPRQIAWTTKEEIALAKGWKAVSENSERGNARKKDGFWVEVMEYMESKTKMEGCRTYDMVLGKWKSVRSAVVRFCGVYNNVMRMAQESGAGDEDYVQKAMIHYQAETRLPFKFRHCWDVLKDSPKFADITFPNLSQGSQGSNKRHKSSGSSSFNTESGDASINLNNTVAGDDEVVVDDDDEVQEFRRPVGRDKARAAGKNKGSKASASSTMNDDALLAQQEDMKLYLQPYNYLTEEKRLAWEEIRAKIKAKYNLQF
ncbi:glutathione S-transferase T3-like protein [Tanacetum coccineum]